VPCFFPFVPSCVLLVPFLSFPWSPSSFSLLLVFSVFFDPFTSFPFPCFSSLSLLLLLPFSFCFIFHHPNHTKMMENPVYTWGCKTMYHDRVFQPRVCANLKCNHPTGVVISSQIPTCKHISFLDRSSSILVWFSFP